MTYEKRLAELAAKGATAQVAFAALTAEGVKRKGKAPSLPTVGRDLGKLRGPQRMGRRHRATLPAIPALPTEAQIAETSDPLTLDEWLAVAGRAAKAAELRGDPVALHRFGNLATAILAAKAKTEPPPVVDPATSPDMIGAAKSGRAKIFALFDRLVAEVTAAT